MKKISLYIIMAVSLLAGCRRDDDHVFDKSPEERINEVMTRYQSVIGGAADGWQAQIITGDSSYFGFYFRFNNDNRVWMMSDYSQETANTVKESSYRLKALQNPTLIFDTYSYLHMLADPDAEVAGGEYGSGRVSDFEFTIDTLTADSIHLTGRFNGTVMVMKKATAQQRAAWENKQVRDGLVALGNIKNIQQYFKRLTYNGTTYEITIDEFSKTISFTWLVNGVPNTVTRGYYIVPGGIQFSDIITAGNSSFAGMTITGFAANTLNVTINGTATGIVGFNNGPLLPDATAFARFRNLAVSESSYYITVDGFHVNGVDDFHNMKSLKTDTSVYIYTLYWPEFDPGIDLIAPIYLNTAQRQAELNYGLGVGFVDNKNGRARLVDIGDIPPYPTSGPAFGLRQQFNVSGQNYWFIQVGPRAYDMVSVTDAKVWISWRLFPG